MQGLYGATSPYLPDSRPGSFDRKSKAAAAGGDVQQAVPVAVALLVPWLVFTATAGLLSFAVHYEHSRLCWFCVLLGACAVLVCGAMALRIVHSGRGASVRDPTWYIVVAASLAFWWTCGVACGQANYYLHMSPFYDITSLNLYPNIDPAKVGGRELLDAGRVIFSRNAQVNASFAYGFRDEVAYCVAPVVSDVGPLASYDFWVVGKDCCNNAESSFTCGDVQDPRARSGMRLLDDRDVRYYRLAVDQVKLAHGIRADFPMFFRWAADPISEVARMQERGLRLFLHFASTAFGVQLFVVTLVAVRSFRHLLK